ncbi:hypothetical protein B0A50_05857 [Salinomyces thailandicus]|uniref:RING-type domain-containing protein n=1 Tax=Salinomyces thailandicus TaxID=706561 RepID=A0A4U0TU24_9PEZI|nr:hypothetical protein B0A50_05857 [Salinomyces thailandica]
MASYLECSVCLEDRPTSSFNPNHSVEGNPICTVCADDTIVPLFQQALQFEYAWPPRYGNQEFSAAAFHDHLGEAFLRQYRQREREYQTLPSDRIYCRNRVLVNETNPTALTEEQINEAGARDLPTDFCGHFNGNKPAVPQDATSLGCRNCGGSICPKCFEPLISSARSHACRPETTNPQETPTNDFAGQTRGRDYQLCPNPACKLPIYLGEGCNHCICPSGTCRTEFCFICGTPAVDRSGHWDDGQPCPRFNQPGDAGALYDDWADDIEMEDDETEDEEGDDEMEDDDDNPEFHGNDRITLTINFEPQLLQTLQDPAIIAHIAGPPEGTSWYEADTHPDYDLGAAYLSMERYLLNTAWNLVEDSNLSENARTSIIRLLRCILVVQFQAPDLPARYRADYDQQETHAPGSTWPRFLANSLTEELDEHIEAYMELEDELLQYFRANRETGRARIPLDVSYLLVAMEFVRAHRETFWEDTRRLIAGIEAEIEEEAAEARTENDEEDMEMTDAE